MSGASDGAEIVVICGPTGAGKSDLALRLAERSGRAILVADSRQVYRGFDVGTAKPTVAEQRRVRHLGIDLVDPRERYSAAQWAAFANVQLAGEPPPIVVGGTGLYLRALFDGLFDEPAVDASRRRALIDWLDGHPTEELRRWVTQLDPARASLGRTQLLRAIEVALLTGTRISDLHATRATVSRWRARYLVVDPGPRLHERIAKRLDAMIEAGWLDEVRALRGVPDDAPAWKSSGYRTLRDVVDGVVRLDEARERILIETRQYAKRQRTWFRHQLPEDRTTRINPETDEPGAIDAWFAAMNK
ncbi:MAG: tRNA (adenosine(37)-N6)-dimethylallyltransferase MiaA [Gemmatimonadaceae bacterium]